MLLSLHALKSLNSIQKIPLRMMEATFNGNPSTKSSPATVLTLLEMKWTASPSITSYPPSSIASPNTMF